MEKQIGIVGLGRCGMPAAKKYIDKGFTVYGYARREEVIVEFEMAGGKHVANPAELARRAKTVIVMVLNDEQVIDVVTGEAGLLKTTGTDSTIICMATINGENLKRMDCACRERGVRFIDCPFTGGPARVENGTLTLIAAAPENELDVVRPVLEVIGHITYAGPEPGMGQAIKHCNQLLVTTIHAATIELILLARKTGVDPKLVCDVVGSGIGGNDYFRLLAKGILENTSSPGGMGQLWKDVNIAVTSARRHNLPLLTVNAASQYFNMAVAQGLAAEDSARLMDVLEKMVDPAQKKS
ncbi:MAG: NAD(P)-dependent oxidoreductase [Deltaproteobacteria bacterium]|nr:NAD(P)-dependent oxidoreductase [Deltaproteobacteria bacterium]